MQFPHMLLQIKVPTESFRTVLTIEWLLIGMRMHMKRQIVYLVKSFGTYVAFVRLHLGVGQPVVLVVPLLVKSFVTDLAYKGFVSQVDPHVGVER